MTRKLWSLLKLPAERIYLFFRNFSMKHPFKIYITTSIICFLVLALVQFILVYNTYDLLNRRFYYEKKSKINEEYSKAITNDKLFPGGQAIIDSTLVPQLRTLEQLYYTDTTKFQVHSQHLLNQIFHRLIRSQTIDSLMRQIREKENITDSLRYALNIARIDIMTGNKKYINIYDSRKKYELIDDSLQWSDGIRIYGDLKNPDERSQVARLNVSNAMPYTYAMAFSFHAEPFNRRQMVFRQMRLMLTMSLLSMFAIILLFFITMRNWIKQKRLSDVKTDFINNITHEFHTPLSAIMVANKNIQNEKILDNKMAIKSLSDVIERQSHRLKLLFGQVLDLATVDKLFVQKKPHHLNMLVNEILTDFSIKFSTSNVQIDYTPAEEDLVVNLDSFHFTTLMLNILDNAVKYNLQPVKDLVIVISNDKENIYITVSDTGIGMSRETLKHIFEKFYRYQKDLTQNTKGLGLGLHYVKQCIDAHKWKLKVDSEVGKGTTFVIVIPV
ncbi:sensor histidine kinase KdpD [Chitinophaga sp. CF418]|uniref:sensor histidine kinase n=1 Tax=Chitinophaga sp. CF418 TaxID=1855287 RepID=UPI000913AEA7|nr:HAMP domain-containing sensor histidine kinase [Chitinophaga sp. CF418]SHN42616.1 two-component system, OmpR family, phosphate regulon sensor histidine kinase PhoR [Chitinophaga sp. CF418]